VELPRDLREGIESAVAGVPGPELAEAVERLIDRYRQERPAEVPILSGPVEVAAYAVYRMPATFAAVQAALTQVKRAYPGLEPATQFDLGGGTGAAVWAAHAVFPLLQAATVLDQVDAAVDVGRRIADQLPVAWRESTVDTPADLVTVSYVLSELSTSDQEDLVRRAGRAATQAVVVIEPGTPAGYQRILHARDVLLSLGLRVYAPCPHQAACPLGRGDWCHFAARVNRSALHRRLKSAEMSYEDEKYAYVAAGPGGPEPAPWGRVLRRPQQRKGLVSLRVCTPGDGVAAEVISKRQGDRYKAARDVHWGDAWGSTEPHGPTA
jgi:ribosomal protein RSM22 (predicted rRNA methylase)